MWGSRIHAASFENSWQIIFFLEAPMTFTTLRFIPLYHRIQSLPISVFFSNNQQFLLMIKMLSKNLLLIVVNVIRDPLLKSAYCYQTIPPKQVSQCHQTIHCKQYLMLSGNSLKKRSMP